jgi:hypothetical protein
MQDANQLPNNRSGGMSVWLQRRERDGGNDREKDFSTQPDDEG